MPPDQRKTEMDDTPSEADVMDDLVNDMQVTSDIQDNSFADRVYTRFLSVPGPGVVTAPVFPWVIDKRKTGLRTHRLSRKYYKCSLTNYRLFALRVTIQLPTVYTIGSCHKWRQSWCRGTSSLSRPPSQTLTPLKTTIGTVLTHVRHHTCEV